MRRTKWAMAVAGVACMFATAHGRVHASSNEVGAASALSKGAASGLIVKLKPTADEGKLQSLTQARARFGRLSRLSVAAGYTSTMPWRHVNAQTTVLATPSSLTPAMQQKLIDRLMATGQVEWVEANVRQHAFAPSSTTYDIGNQWWLAPWDQGNRGAPGISNAWQRIIREGLANDNANRAVAVLDTGVNAHPNLTAGRLLPGYDFVSNPVFAGQPDDSDGWDSNPTDEGDEVSANEARSTAFVRVGCGVELGNSWHGTIVASVVAATPTGAVNIKGVNPSARILPVRIAGKCGADLADIVAGMYWSAGIQLPEPVLQQERLNASAGGYTFNNPPVPVNANPARVLNLSFGGPDACGSFYQEAVNALRGQGTVVVASAGNEHTSVARPANCNGVVAVAALNREGFKSTYSNFGPQISVSTLGGDPGSRGAYTDGGAWGAQLGDDGLLLVAPTSKSGSSVNLVEAAGTSYSAPIVSGVISLMLDVFPTMTVDQIELGLRASARPHVVSSFIGACSSDNPGRCICTTSTCGAGILDAEEAVVYAIALKNRVPYTRGTSSTGHRIDADSPFGGNIQRALRVASQDRLANPATSSSVGAAGTSNADGGGGGGSTDAFVLGLMLAALAGAGFSSRKQ